MAGAAVALDMSLDDLIKSHKQAGGGGRSRGRGRSSFGPLTSGRFPNGCATYAPKIGTITKPTNGLFLMAAVHLPHHRGFFLSSNFINNYYCSRTATTAKAMTPPLNSYSKENEDEEELTSRNLRKGIAEFYDESSGLWESIWGDHMHHGFYDTTNATYSLSDHQSAQLRMIEQSLRFAQVSEDPLKRPKSIVDVGCGIGGSSLYLAKKYDAECQGITLSVVQAQRAQALAAAQGLANKVSFQVADALNQPFLDGQFDLVWSMESGEHMPDKSKFVNELARVTAPGGTIIIVTWCHRDLFPSEKSLRPDERDLLKKICDAYYLPAWCSAADYVELLKSLSLQDVRREDWTEHVAPFWPAVIRTALTWRGFTSLLTSGWKTIKGALVMPLMIQGYNKGLIKFAIITCRKPPPYLH